jgi:hypothetical protein
MFVLAAEMQTRSTIVRNEREHKHATTYQGREGPVAFFNAPVLGATIIGICGNSSKDWSLRETI